jgi:hypothetical protein
MQQAHLYGFFHEICSFFIRAVSSLHTFGKTAFLILYPQETQMPTYYFYCLYEGQVFPLETTSASSCTKQMPDPITPDSTCAVFASLFTAAASKLFPDYRHPLRRIITISVKSPALIFSILHIKCCLFLACFLLTLLQKDQQGNKTAY